MNRRAHEAESSGAQRACEQQFMHGNTNHIASISSRHDTASTNTLVGIHQYA